MRSRNGSRRSSWRSRRSWIVRTIAFSMQISVGTDGSRQRMSGCFRLSQQSLFELVMLNRNLETSAEGKCRRSRTPMRFVSI